MNKKKISKFLISGTTAAFVEYTVFLLFGAVFSGGLLILNQSFSFLCGFFVSFFLNKKWVFKSDGNTKKELVRYSVLAGINLMLSNVIIHLLVDSLNIPQWGSKIMVMALVALWNYTIFSRLIFKSD